MLATLEAVFGYAGFLRDCWDDAEFRALAAVAVVQLTVGTVVFAIIEDWSLLDSAYFCVVSLCTVGYGDFAPTTAFGRLFAIFYLLAGVGLFVTLVAKLAAARVQRREREPLLHRYRRVESGQEGEE